MAAELRRRPESPSNSRAEHISLYMTARAQSLNELSISIVDDWFRTRPPHDEDITIFRGERIVSICTKTVHVSVLQHSYEDGSVEFW